MSFASELRSRRPSALARSGLFTCLLRGAPSVAAAVAVTLGIGASGCASRDGTPSIESKILITMSEQLQQSGRSLILTCRTEKPYGTFNYPQFDRAGATIRITFQQEEFFLLRQPELRVPLARIDLGPLAPGAYHLAIDAGGKTLKAVLTVSADSYVVTNGEGTTVDFPAARLNRVPENTIWGLIGYLGSQGQPFDSLADAFLDSLAARGAAAGSFEPGDYGYFSIDESGAIQRPPHDGYYYALPYIRQFAGDPTTLQDVVAYFGRTQSNWLSVRLLTWRGDTYYGWILGSGP